MVIIKFKFLKILARFLFCYLLFSIGFSLNAGTQSYILGISDVINLSIYAGGEKQHDVELEVSEKGTISVPFLGVIKAEGLTVEDLGTRIGEPLAKDYYVDPRVVIQIKEYHSKEYKIFGAVKNPGLFASNSDLTLLDLMAKAGGLSTDHGQFAFIVKGSEELSIENIDELTQDQSLDPLKVDLLNLLESGNPDNNITLRAGDYVYIPVSKSSQQTDEKIYLEGEVRSPGAFDFKPGLTALNACIMAGGFSQYAAPNRTIIIRQTGEEIEKIKINLKHIKSGKIPDIELKPGDRIHVPQSWF